MTTQLDYYIAAHCSQIEAALTNLIVASQAIPPADLAPESSLFIAFLLRDTEDSAVALVDADRKATNAVKQAAENNSVGVTWSKVRFAGHLTAVIEPNDVVLTPIQILGCLVCLPQDRSYTLEDRSDIALRISAHLGLEVGAYRCYINAHGALLQVGIFVLSSETNATPVPNRSETIH